LHSTTLLDRRTGPEVTRMTRTSTDEHGPGGSRTSRRVTIVKVMLGGVPACRLRLSGQGFTRNTLRTGMAVSASRCEATRACDREHHLFPGCSRSHVQAGLSPPAESRRRPLHVLSVRVRARPPLSVALRDICGLREVGIGLHGRGYKVPAASNRQRAIFRLVPATTAFPRRRLSDLIRVTVVSNSCAIDESVSPRLTR
jgi:hypothetical protein